MSYQLVSVVVVLTLVVAWMRRRFRRHSWQKTLDRRSTMASTTSAVQAELALLKVKPTAERNINSIVQTLCVRGFVLVALIEDEKCDLEQHPSHPPTYTVLLAVSPLLLHKLSIQRGDPSGSIPDDRMQLMMQAMEVLLRCNNNATTTTNNKSSMSTTGTPSGDVKLFEECVLIHDSRCLLRTLDTDVSPQALAASKADVMQPWSSLSSPLVR